MTEVEAQLVRSHVGAGLAHVRAQHPAKGRLQQMGRRVIALGGTPGAGVHARQHRLALGQRAPLHDHAERLVVPEPEDVLDPRPAVPALAFDRADVGDLAPAGGIEG